MKKMIRKFSPMAIGIAVVMTMSCNNSSDSGSTTVTDTSSVKTDNTTATMPTSTDTSNMNATKNSTTTTTTTGKKKGKVSAVMTSASNTGSTTTSTSNNGGMDKSGYYNSVEILPTYPGGQSALDAYINNNVTYPDQAMQDSKEGTVVVHFAIDENGKVSNAKVTNTPLLGEGLEDEAIKVISGMPNWTPGMVKGKKVKSYYSLPIRFTLE